MAQRVQSPDRKMSADNIHQTTPFIAYDRVSSPPIPPKSPLRQLSYFDPFPQMDPSLRLLSSASPQYSFGSPERVSSPPIISPPISPPPGWSIVPHRPMTHYAEFVSPDPEIAYPQPVGNDDFCDDSCRNVSSTFISVTPDCSSSIIRKPIPRRLSKVQRRKTPIYQKSLWIALFILTLFSIVAAVACAVIFGIKRSSSSLPTTGATGNPALAVGGYLDPAYYSKSGTWNGTGIAVAAANPGVDQTTYVFFQDYQGRLTYKLIQRDGTVTQSLGVVNDANSNPMNGTPLSIVNHRPTPNNLVYHLFYIDEDYNMVERVLETDGKNQNASSVPLWKDGPLTSKKLQALKSTSIGMQACYWNNFYGGWNNNARLATDAIQLWFATSETQFAQYTWTNGTSSWDFDQTWDGLDGHAGVGCQTWDSLTSEYVWFVDKDQKLAMYWRDNDKYAISTASHPTLQWVKLSNFDIPTLHKSTSLGYTNYLLYQLPDASIQGANFNFSAESTALQTNQGKLDTFVVQDQGSDRPVSALLGTHMAITAVQTASLGTELQVFFQQNGSDIIMYTRGMNSVGGNWKAGAKIM